MKGNEGINIDWRDQRRESRIKKGGSREKDRMEELLLIRRTREENQGLRIEDQEQWREYRDYC